MNKLQQALLEASAEEIAEVLLPFSEYGVKTFPELLEVFVKLDTFKKAQTKLQEQQKTEAQKLAERKEVVQEILNLGVDKKVLGDRPEDSLLVEAVIALPVAKREDLIRMYLPTELPSGQKKHIPLKETEEEKEVKLAEEEAKELVSAFPNAGKK